MGFSSWLTSRKRRGSPCKRASFRPTLEALEGRDVPSTLTVTNNLDNGNGSSLRAEIAAAHNGDTIVFANNVTGIISLKGASAAGGFELYINKNLDIKGPGASRLAIQGINSRVFEVAAEAQVTLSGLTIEGGNGRYGGFDPQVNDGLGGGILNWGALLVNKCALTGNSSGYGYGGAIYNAGTLTISRGTVSRNAANYGGGGIYNAGTAAALTVLDSSFRHNSPDNIFGPYTDGGGNTFK